MKRLIYGECIKDRVLLCLFSMVVLVLTVSYLTRVWIVERTVSYVDIPVNIYAFSMICNSWLLMVFPCVLLLLNIWFSMIESNENGWILILTNVRKTRNILFVKFLVNLLVCLTSYLSLTGVCCYLLKERGADVLFSSVAVPMLCSLVCFLPYALILQLLTILLPNVIAKLSVGLFLIVAMMFVTQTEFQRYCFLSCYVTIIQDLGMWWWRIAFSLVITALLLFEGGKMVDYYIRKTMV